jgi:hypothetical protein
VRTLTARCRTSSLQVRPATTRPVATRGR